jgi:hypothetical protein
VLNPLLMPGHIGEGLLDGSGQIHKVSVLEMQLAKRRGGRERTLAAVINGVALFTFSREPTPRIGLCESRPAQYKYDRRNDSRDLRHNHAVITKAWTIADGGDFPEATGGLRSTPGVSVIPEVPNDVLVGVHRRRDEQIRLSAACGRSKPLFTQQ